MQDKKEGFRKTDSLRVNALPAKMIFGNMLRSVGKYLDRMGIFILFERVCGRVD